MKGQVEITLELSEKVNEPQAADPSLVLADAPSNGSKPPKPFRKHFSLNEMQKKIQSLKKPRYEADLSLKVTATKLRCSIKVKDEIELVTDSVYVKTAVYERDILVNSWKCDSFAPTLSMRWDPEASAVIVPLNSLDDLEHIVIRATIATKTKMGKKIVLGTVLIGPNSTGLCLEQWNNAVANANLPIAVWHNFQ